MRKVERFIIAIPICFTLLVGWFSWSSFQSAPQIAEENLRGAGLSIATAIEQFASVDPAFQALARYRTADIAYFALIDQHKVVRFHTNSALVGTVSAEAPPVIDSNSGISEERKKLGTGEEIYLLQTTIHGSGDDYLLTLGLHTFRADRVIRRAQTGVTVVVFLTISLWLVTLGVMYLLRRDEKRQRELARQAELARLGELGAVIAHEIRNPLAGIKGFAQLIETAETTDQARLYADRIVTQSLRMESLVNDLLSFVREDQGERLPTDLAAVVHDCVTMIRMEADSAGVAVIHTPHPSLKVMSASGRIIQLLLNLLKNGLQAMPDGGELRVELEKMQSLAIIRVCDSGIGISPEILPHIFEPFWTNKARGTGLGLALCRKVALEHGGRLTVESSVGSGTTFTLQLPLET
ncbi:MAG TPA: HAMP domain-containing histidine kinase [Desulfuromonadales bacterium]|nr:HAMP domain-containing histidine kinase [Desulfuromonadales bacterium]